MFDAIPGFVSINKISDLKPGTYSKRLAEYQNQHGTAAVLISEFRFEGDPNPVVVDLIVIDNNSFVRAADFIQIKSGQWRSSTGQVGNTLSEILPPEINKFRMINQKEEGQLYVNDGRFYIL